MSDPQDTLPEDWHAFEADREIDRDGVKASLVSAIDAMIGESIQCCLCNVFGHTNPYDPKVGLDYAKIKLERCFARMNLDESRTPQSNSGNN